MMLNNPKRHPASWWRFLCVVSGVCLFLLALSAQQGDRPATRKIEIVHADFTEFAASIDSNAWRLKGAVQFFHEGVTMNCDSAWWYRTGNTLDAFGNIVISKPEGTDQVVITGDFLRYNGETRLSEIWGNVVMNDQDMEMTTDHVYYDMASEVCYYLSGAHIRNLDNTLYSIKGHFHRLRQKFYFKQDVVMHSPDYDINTDTLVYDVHSALAEFAGPTHIVSPQKDTIYCELGWYDRTDTIAFFHRNAWMKSGSNQLFADTLFFDKTAGIGEAFHDVCMTDTVNGLIISGQYGYYDSRERYTYVTDSTLLIMTGEQDSLFMHGDTLYTFVDTAGIRTVEVYNGVRFYSRDLQGKCDSLAYATSDSVIRLFFDPVVWGQSNQMSSETIEVEMADNSPRQINLKRGALMISPEDSLGFNQLKGRNITGYFRGNRNLYKILAKEDAEAVFFAKDGPDYIGVNRAKSTDIRILLTDDRKFDEVMFIGATSGKLFPIEKMPGGDDLKLQGFVWREDVRPRDRFDIYRGRQAATGSAAVQARRKAMMVDGMIFTEPDEDAVPDSVLTEMPPVEPAD